MGLGPNGKSLRKRLEIAHIEQRVLESLRAEIALLQQARSLARALAQMKRREATPRQPRPRKHKNHCNCLENSLCCRCKGAKCVRPKLVKREKSVKP